MSVNPPLTPKQRKAIFELTPYGERTSFTVLTGDKEMHSIEIECGRDDSGKVKIALIDLLPDADDWKAKTDVTPSKSGVTVSLEYENVPIGNSSPVLEVAKLMKEHGINYKGSDYFARRGR